MSDFEENWHECILKLNQAVLALRERIAALETVVSAIIYENPKLLEKFEIENCMVDKEKLAKD